MKHYILFAALLLTSSCTMIPGPRPAAPLEVEVTWTYPEARQGDVVEDFHGTPVPDPYQWMKDPDSPETTAWVEAQNQLTRSYLDAIPEREAIKARLTELWNYPRYSLPSRHGDRYFFSKNDGLQNQYVLCMVKTLDGEPVVVIDPNTFSEDGTVALTTQAFSWDGQLLAYGKNASGSDWGTMYVRDVDVGVDYEEVFSDMRYTGVAWKHDNSGFYYTRFPTPGTVPEEDLYYYEKVFWHQLGTQVEADILIFELPEQKDLSVYPGISDDGHYLFLYISRGWETNGLYYREVDSDGEFIHLFEEGEARYDVVGNQGSTFYIHTDLNAPRGRVLAMDASKQKQRVLVEIIPQQEDVISSVSLVNDHLVVKVKHNAHELLKIYDLEGNFVRVIDLPTMGSVGGPTGRQQDTEIFFSFTSFVYPTTIYRYDFTTDEVSLFRKSEINFDPTGYETTQVFYPSKDGTRVSMFLTHRKGLLLDGTNPALLYGYGGFNVSILPSFSVARLVFLEAGGVYVVANLRGGSEYGKEWHKAGMLENKQNVFDDFIAAAEWLIDNDYTTRERLAIDGASNGGLLVGACLMQRPDLFGAAIPRVGVLDMLRYHRWGAGRFWTPEYGNAEENPAHFKFLYAYSPLHNVKEGVAYPPTLITTANTDDRVVPVHSKKFAATLQAKDAGANPILIRIETKAGHGAGKPTSKRIDEATDIYTFLIKTLGMELE
ncbi:Prolyl endopeptidase [subsurface metagenome]